jgi:hypothetical protein
VQRSLPSCVVVPQPPRRDDQDQHDDKAYQRILHQLSRDRRASRTATTSAEHALGPPAGRRGCPLPSDYVAPATVPDVQPAPGETRDAVWLPDYAHDRARPNQ